MRTPRWKNWWTVGLLLAAAAGGCQRQEGTRAASTAGALPTELGATIGSLADVVKPRPVAVEGYGLVGGLAGTGSGYCPPQVRAYLKQYILAQLPDQRINVDELIESKNTAVVRLEALIPPTPSKGEPFDVQVALLPGTEATSLRGGWLYKADLLAAGTFGADTKPLATVEGPVFIDSIGAAEVDVRGGYILGGGRTLYEYAALLRLRKPDYRNISLMRNRLSERYGPYIAQAISPSDIEVRIPAEYSWRKMRFVSMIPATYLEVTNELNRARIDTLAQLLIASDNKDNAEMALEAVGRESVGALAALLSAPEAEVRLRAGRCLIGLGDERGLAPLRDLAVDSSSPYRRAAFDAIVGSPRRADGAVLARRLLREEDTAIVLAAYEYLRETNDPTVRREVVGRSFSLEQVAQSRPKAIFVSRSGDPRVVLFGAPLTCRDNLFVESPGQTIVLDSRPGQDFVSVIRKHPTRPGVIGPIRSGRDVGELIRTLGREAVAGRSGQLQGLGIPYAEIIALLEQLPAREVVTAEFWAGPLPKIGPTVKK